MYQQNEPITPTVVVVPHVAVGHDVEARFFLVADHRGHGVGVCLFVLDFLECDPNVAAQELVLEPVRPRVRPDHRGRKNFVDDLRCHVPLCWFRRIDIGGTPPRSGPLRLRRRGPRLMPKPPIIALSSW
jgi:hypothetical protein